MSGILEQIRRTTTDLLNKAQKPGEEAEVPAKAFIMVRGGEIDTLERMTGMFERFLGPVEFEAEPSGESKALMEADDPSRGPLRTVAFEKIVPAEKIPELLRASLFADSDSRSIVLSGCITRVNVVGYFGSGAPQRLFMGDGFFAELQMYLEGEVYHTLPWTNPAFQSIEFQEFCCRVRENLPR